MQHFNMIGNSSVIWVLAIVSFCLLDCNQQVSGGKNHDKTIKPTDQENGLSSGLDDTESNFDYMPQPHPWKVDKSKPERKRKNERNNDVKIPLSTTKPGFRGHKAIRDSIVPDYDYIKHPLDRPGEWFFIQEPKQMRRGSRHDPVMMMPPAGRGLPIPKVSELDKDRVGHEFRVKPPMPLNALSPILCTRHRYPDSEYGDSYYEYMDPSYICGGRRPMPL